MKLYMILAMIFVFLLFSAVEPALAAESRNITLEDNGKTITLQVNETFLLYLGEGYDWNVTVDNQTVLSRVVNVLVVRGAQGIYKAHKSGQAMLTAIGDPICRKEQPPCEAPSRQFRLYVVVTEGATPAVSGFGLMFSFIGLTCAFLLMSKTYLLTLGATLPHFR